MSEFGERGVSFAGERVSREEDDTVIFFSTNMENEK
jgi:hypothetical protein